MVMMNFRPSSSGANGKPPKTAVPPDARPCATRFRYPSPVAPHLLPKHGRQAVLLPSSKGHLAQLSANPAMQYETICFRSRRMRPLVFHVADYGDCGTGTLCREKLGGWSPCRRSDRNTSPSTATARSPISIWPVPRGASTARSFRLPR
ncbi:MAG: hypothetical protein E5X83_05670 [Mesorhizobium sp.]|nr:MAG: hypothetical protein EOR82_20485 [Mesorhizobium sp.]TIO26814.1 MAG: hypothetical protein E5X83_05670 [Mesorhizobium sp.]TJV60251.1 MAG: hypothetical protein E5X82_12540 [Mesorhizobium sp.]